MAKTDLYNYPRRLEQALEKVRKEDICDENKKAIAAFSKVKLAKGTTIGRVAKVVFCLRLLAK